MREKFEKDVEDLEAKIKMARKERTQIEVKESDIKAFIQEVKKIVEHPAEIILDTSNLESHNNIFGLMFEKLPTYDELVSGTPKMAWIFDSFTKNSPKEVIVTLRGVGPRFAA